MKHMAVNKSVFTKLAAIIVLILAVSLSGCAQTKETKGTIEADQPKDTFFQVSTINAIALGVYDGVMSCGDLKKHGNQGIGTFDGLDGEMVVVDGRIFQVKDDGKAYPADDAARTPFAAVTFFNADQNQELKNISSFEELQKRLDGMIENRNLFYSFRIDGTFSYVKTRSVPKQSKPYPTLVEVTKNQPTFEFHDVKGTLTGFWCPEFAQAINVPGYHIHFITEDRERGGHLLECSLIEGTVQVDRLENINLSLPAHDDFGRADLAADTSEDLKKAE